MIIALYSLGILRAWTLLGDPQYGLSGWLNPLQDLEAMEEMAEQQEMTGIDTNYDANQRLNKMAAIRRNTSP